MGTSYTLQESDKIEVFLDEMSNKLQLCIFDKIKDELFCSERFEPTEMLQIFTNGIKNTSYWMTKEEFDAVFNKLETYPF